MCRAGRLLNIFLSLNSAFSSHQHMLHIIHSSWFSIFKIYWTLKMLNNILWVKIFNILWFCKLKGIKICIILPSNGFCNFCDKKSEMHIRLVTLWAHTVLFLWMTGYNLFSSSFQFSKNCLYEYFLSTLWKFQRRTCMHFCFWNRKC